MSTGHSLNHFQSHFPTQATPLLLTIICVAVIYVLKAPIKRILEFLKLVKTDKQATPQLTHEELPKFWHVVKMTQKETLL